MAQAISALPQTLALAIVLAQWRWAISMATASKTSPLPTAAPVNVSILLGDGTGNFSAPTNFAVGDRPYSVAVGDFNGDGKQDLAVANYRLRATYRSCWAMARAISALPQTLRWR